MAAVYHDELYNYYAIGASGLVLAGATWFYQWNPPAGREGYRLLGFFVCGQAFLSSGISIVSRVDTAPLMVTPTQEAFSFAVLATVVFSVMFLVGALVTAPRAGQSLANPARTTSGPKPLVSLIVSIAAAVLTLDFALTTSIQHVGRFGTLPLVLFNIGLLAPLLTAQEVLTGRRRWLPLAVIIVGQAAITFYTSALGALVLTLRDILLARIYLRRGLPVLLLGSMLAAVIILNPVKYLFRNALATNGSSGEMTFDRASSLWGEGVETVWTPTRRSESHTRDFESTSHRLDYNWVSAHIYRTVPRRVPYEMGGTYAIIPSMLVPRVLNPDKGKSAEYARGDWFIKLGIQNSRSVEFASLALPAPAEAYWNFGWPGVFLVPTILGAAVGLMLRLSPKDPVARAGYLVLLVVSLGQFLDMLVWIAPAFITVGLGGVIAHFLSRLGRGPWWSGQPAASLPLSPKKGVGDVRSMDA